MMILQIIKAFIIIALLPIVLFALGASFLIGDIAMMNPLEWVMPAKFMCLVWIATILLCLLGELTDASYN